MSGIAVWRGYDRPALDAQYDVSPPPSPERERRRREVDAENARVRATADCRLDIAYGEGADERLDVFPARSPGSPVVLNIHGGYWKQFAKSDESLYAPLLTSAGAAYVAIDYTLAPAATLDEIVRQCRAATAWVARNAAGFGGDPARIHLLGRSAGAHLCAMMLAVDWRAASGLRESPIAGAALISGLYDLEPVRLCFANGWTRLDADAARRLSPIHHLPVTRCPLIVAWGGAETEEFRRQSADYAAACRAAGFACETIEIPGALHSGSREALLDAGSALAQAILAQAGLRAPR
jgi:arylformamidase